MNSPVRAKTVRHKALQPAAADRVGDLDWKREIGRITFYNLPPAQLLTPVVEDTPLRSPSYRNAVITRSRHVATEGGFSQHTGSVYDGSGNLLAEFAERQMWESETWQRPPANPLQISPSRMAGAERLEGTYVYLGLLHQHFGHFLIESLARAWYLIDCDPRIKVIFHHGHESFALTGFFRILLGALNVDSSRIVTTPRDVVVENLIVPTCQLWYQQRGHRGYRVLFDHLRETIVGNRPTSGLPRKIYLTRDRLTPGLLKKAEGPLPARRLKGLYRKMAANENEVEQLFARHGFEIVAPESLPFVRQVRLVANATHIAGLAGSALHMSMFNGDPATKLIDLYARQKVDQAVLDAIRGLDGRHVFCLRRYDPKGRPVLDTDVIARALEDIMRPGG